MDTRTREVLEVEKVFALVGGRAASSLGRTFVEGLTPLPTVEAIERRYAPIRDLIALLNRNEKLPLGGLFDPSEILQRARVEGSALDEEDWPRLATFLVICGRITRFRDESAKKYPALATMLAGLEANPELERALERVFDDEGNVRDHASPELAAARRGLAAGEARLRRVIDRLTGDLADRGVLQESFSTIRNGRFVFPVRAGSRGRVNGIMHGASASGETVYIEPAEVVEAGNEIETLREMERREVFRILRDLTNQLRPFLPSAENNLQLLRQLDGLYALARTSVEKGWNLPIIVREGALRLFNAHHPLLNLRAAASVPITILLERTDRCVVLSGPNAGGKTTAMKTIGLLTLLAKCGCPIPAFPDSSIPVYTDILADIGDQQDLEEGISTFTGHVRRIRELWRKATDHSLVLMDELGTGTDPQEGGALAVALLEAFTRRAALTITTSHLNPVKVWAEDTQGVRNASFSLDPATREPTFNLRLDLPGASEALEIAEREGLDASILTRARDLAGPRQLEMGELLRRIEDRERRLAAALKEAQARAKALEEQDKLLRARTELLREERRELKEREVREREKSVAEVREKLERMIAELPSVEELQRRKEALVRAREEVLRQQNLTNNERRRLAEEQVTAGEVAPGQHVYIRTIRQWGEIVELEQQSDRVRLLVGQMEVSARLDDLLDHDPDEEKARRRLQTEELELTTGGKRGKKGRKIKRALLQAEDSTGRPSAPTVTFAGKSVSIPSRPTSMNLDLHGFRVEEALKELDYFLDRSLLAGFPHVRVCHGTGSGRLYKAVHEFLRRHASVKSFRFGTTEEGGGGITIIDL